MSYCVTKLKTVLSANLRLPLGVRVPESGYVASCVSHDLQARAVTLCATVKAVAVLRGGVELCRTCRWVQLTIKPVLPEARGTDTKRAGHLSSHITIAMSSQDSGKKINYAQYDITSNLHHDIYPAVRDNLRSQDFIGNQRSTI